MVLDDILERKRQEVNELKKRLPLAKLIKQIDSTQKDRRSFKQALSRGKKTHFICELKKASPSEGLLREHFQVEEIAQEFEEAGASAISVLTERHYFLGNPRFLKQARLVTSIPILRKDFIVDPYQVYETRALGADAFLIIVHLLSNTKLKELLKTADALKLDTLVEAHTKEELDRALEAGSKLIGINNRNLKTLETDLTVSERLIPFIPKGVIAVVESGIETRTDIKRYQQLGINHFLIGTSLMKSKNIKQKIRELNGQLNGVQ